MSFNGKTVWVVGASTGIGKALAERLADDGAAAVCVSSRSEDALQAMAAERPAIRPYPLDVTDKAAVAAAAEAIEREVGAIDIAVFNAGAYTPMGLDDWDLAEIETGVAVNYLGVVYGLDAVMAPMRTRGRGRVALTASVAGYRGLPNAISYGPTKAAIISLAETLRNELKDAGVTLQVINPGFVRTPLTDKNDFEMPQLIEPEDAAREIAKGLQSDKFEIAFPRPFVWQLMLLRMLPYPWFFRLIRTMTGV
ncbi:MAG: SDR family NAD(P)-dependent oxidoreductase [Pseudomonadota bacterium]